MCFVISDETKVAGSKCQDAGKCCNLVDCWSVCLSQDFKVSKDELIHVYNSIDSDEMSLV